MGLTALTNFHIWTMLTNGSSVLLKLVFTTITGKHKAKEKLRRKAILPLKTEQLHLQRVGIFVNMRIHSMRIRYQRMFSFYNIKKIIPYI